MKLSPNVKNQESSNQVLETFSYKLDSSEEATALIAETLRKSYQKPIQTSVQEYLSNARDIHRELGIKKAIKVQVPTELNPEFFIRDFGSGLSKEGIEKYITFAFSTKRHSNLSTGGFGLGSKSFFAYSDSFTIISYFKGIKYIYRASCVKSAQGALVLINQSSTSEADGLQVQVAVKPADRKQFIEAVFRLKHYWKDQEIEIINLNKEEYLKEPEVVFQSSKSFLIKTVNERNHNHRINQTIRLLIDGIPYEVENFDFNEIEIRNFCANLQRKFSLQIPVATGTLSLAKYREFVETNEENKNKITKIILEAITQIKQEWAEKIGKPKITGLKDLFWKDVEKYFFLNPKGKVAADFHIGNQVYKGSIESQYHEEVSVKIKIKPQDININFYRGYGDSKSAQLNHSNTYYYDQHDKSLSFIFGKKLELIFYTYSQNEQQIRKEFNKYCVENSSHGEDGEILNFRTKNELSENLIKFFHANSLISDGNPLKKSSKNKKEEILDLLPNNTIRCSSVGVEDSYLITNRKQDFNYKKVTTPTYLISKTDFNSYILDLDYGRKPQTTKKIRQMAASVNLWGCEVLIVNDQLFDFLLKEKNFFPLKDFNADNHRKDKKLYQKALSTVTELHAYYLSQIPNVAALHLCSTAKLLPSNEIKLVNEFVKSVKQGEHDFVQSDFTNAGLGKEYDQIAKRDGQAIFNLLDKYTFLPLVDRYTTVKPEAKDVLKKLIKEANKRKK